MDDYGVMEVSGSGGGSKPDISAAAAAAYENMGKEKEEEKEEESGSDDDDYGSDCGQSESDCEDLMEPIWNLISKDDSDGLMKFLNLPEDGNQKDPDYNYELLKYAFGVSCYRNKLGCLKALLDCGVDWFAENAVGEERLLHEACVADSKDAAELVIAYAKKKKVTDKLLGAGDVPRMTPLHFATLWGSCNVIQLLLDEGADPCKQDNKRKLPCDYANPGTKAKKLLVDAVLNKGRSYKLEERCGRG